MRRTPHPNPLVCTLLMLVACDPTPRTAATFERGLSLYRRAGYDSVLSLTTRALEHEIEPVERARLITLQGYVHYQRADYEAAIERGTAALGLLSSDESESDWAWAQNLLGLVAYQESRFDEALAFFHAVRDVGERGSGRDALEHLTRAAINLGLVYQDLGDFERARSSFSDGVTLAREAGSHRLEGFALNGLGLATARSGLPHEAVDLFRQARAAYRADGDPSRESNTLGQLGLALIDLGDFDRARAVLDSAIALARTYGLKQEEASNLSARAEAEMHAGRLQRALATFTESEALNVALGLPYEAAMDLRSRAVIYRELGEAELANEALDRAATIHDSIGAAWAAFGDQLLAVQFATDAGDLVRANDLVESIRLKVAMFDTRAARVEFGLEDAELRVRQGRWNAALSMLDAIESDVDADQPGWHVTWETIRSRAWTGMGGLDSAVASARRAVELAETVVRGLDERMSRGRGDLSQLQPAVILTRALLAVGDTADAFLAADRARGRPVLDHLARAAATDPSRVDRLAVAARIGRVERQITELDCRAGADWAFGDRRWCAALDSTLATLRSAQSSLSDTSAPGPGLQSLGPSVSISDVKGVLDGSEVLLEYLVDDEGVTAFGVTRDRTTAVRLLVSAEEIHRRVRLVRDVVTDPDGDRRLQREVLRSVYADLVGPVREMMPAGRTLIVVPHGSIGYLPFPALVTPGDQYLIEETEVLLAPSAASLVALRDDTGPPPAFGDVRAFAPMERALPGTREEVASVRDHLASTRVARGRRATKRRFIEALAEADVVHLATHGELRAGNPLVSHLQFGDVEAVENVMTVYEVIELPVRSRLVFLSGCETALGSAYDSRYSQGDEYATLQQAFLQAGASNVVATLWRIDDRASAELVRRFYASYAATGDPLGSLGDAQRAMIASGDYNAPYYWAGFEVAGRGGA